MKTIIITGPSGSGKSYLSNRLSKLFNNSIVIKTDSYYRDNILIRFLSILLYDIYDRPLSIKKDKLKDTLRSIYKRDELILFSKYDLKRKNSSESKIKINYKEDNDFVILEGIFAHRLNLNYKETINIICEEKKEMCFKRRLKRDQIERGRDNIEITKKFYRSWYLFFKNVQTYLNGNKVLSLNTLDQNSYNKLVINLKKHKKNNKEENFIYIS